jgi:hypothetical protein
VREREFNAENRQINAEYLVNILRKFLMCNDMSERHKLAIVLCSILHLRPEESKVIEEKWAVKKGLVGWWAGVSKNPSHTYAETSAPNVGAVVDSMIVDR